MTTGVEHSKAVSEVSGPLQRFLGAWLLDARAFRSARNDPGALVPAALVVLLVGVARGIGAAPEEGSFGVVASPVVSLVFWAVGSVLVWGIATRRFGVTARYVEVLRTLGFASAPLWLLALRAFAPGAPGTGIWLLAHGWSLLALGVATREALRVSQNRALVVLALALAVTLGVLLIMGSLAMLGSGPWP